MTFREIIKAALEEYGAISPRDNWCWKWGDMTLDITFYGSAFNAIASRPRRPEGCLIYWSHAGACAALARIVPSELLDPNWSPEALAKQINDGIAKAKNEL